MERSIEGKQLIRTGAIITRQKWETTKMQSLHNTKRTYDKPNEELFETHLH